MTDEIRFRGSWGVETGSHAVIVSPTFRDVYVVKSHGGGWYSIQESPGRGDDMVAVMCLAGLMAYKWKTHTVYMESTRLLDEASREQDMAFFRAVVQDGGLIDG